VLKKRETLRQLVLSLQSRLNPELQYDVQQGTVPPPAPPLSDTPNMSLVDSVSGAGDADVLNPVTSDDADLVLTSIAQTVANSHGVSVESENTVSSVQLISAPFVDHISDCSDAVGTVSSSSVPIVATVGGSDEESVIMQSVSAVSLTDSTSDTSGILPATADQQTSLSSGLETVSRLLQDPAGTPPSSETSQNVEMTVSDGVCEGACISTSAVSSLILAQDENEHSSILHALTVFECLADSRTHNVPVADAARNVALSTSGPNITDSSSNKDASQVSDAATCAAENNVSSACIVMSMTVSESFVGNSAGGLSLADTASS